MNTQNPAFAVNAGGAWSYLAHVALIDGGGAQQADIQSITRTITDTKTGNVSTTSLDPSDVIHDVMQEDAVRWNVGGDPVPFNFEDRVPAAAIASRRKYTLQYALTPIAGETVMTQEVDIQGD